MGASTESKQSERVDEDLCPDCKGRGLIRPPGEWANETCPRCDGRGMIARTPKAADDG